MAATSLTTYPESRRSPISMSVCSNGHLKKLFVGARITDKGTPPLIYIRSFFSQEISFVNNLTSLNATSYRNVYEYKLSQPMRLQGTHIVLENGDRSSSQVYYYRYGLMRTRLGLLAFEDQPLISVDVGQNSLNFCSDTL